MSNHIQVDRSYEMSLLARLLEPEARQTILLIEAESGYGKSLLMAEYAAQIYQWGHTLAVIDLANGPYDARGLLYGLCCQWGWEHFPYYQNELKEPMAPANLTVSGIQVGWRPNVTIEVPDSSARQQERAHQLTRMWFSDARSWLERNLPVVIVIDSYNENNGAPHQSATVDSAFCAWLKNAFLTELAQIPALRLILAGQQIPKTGMTAWEHRCQRHQLGPIPDPNDWMSYVQQIGAPHVTHEVVSAFCHAQHGHPLAIAVQLSQLRDWKRL